MNYNFEVFETLRKLVLTGGLIFMKPGTGAQIIAAMLMCLDAMRVYAAEKPFIDHEIDRLSEAVQWQLFFVMFSALALRVNLDGPGLQDRKFIDLMMLIIQFLAPAVMVINKLMTWKDGNLKDALRDAAEEGVEQFGGAGLKNAAKLGASVKTLKDMIPVKKNVKEVQMVQRMSSGTAMGAVVLGVGGGGGGSVDSPMHGGGRGAAPVKNKADGGRQLRPNSSFDIFKNPELKVGGGKWGARKKKNISASAPKRKSLLAIPKDKLEEAPTKPPKKLPPSIKEHDDDDDDDDDDVGPPPARMTEKLTEKVTEKVTEKLTEKVTEKQVCQWTEEFDQQQQAVYYWNIDGKTITWDQPDDFWRSEGEKGELTKDEIAENKNEKAKGEEDKVEKAVSAVKMAEPTAVSKSGGDKDLWKSRRRN